MLKYNRLTLVRHDKTIEGKSYWICTCDCGTVCSIRIDSVKNGHTKSCGCFKKERDSQTKHGKVYTRMYTIWTGMIQRCSNSRSTGYHKYGGRGITVCERWLKFENFYKDMGDPPKKEYSLDRLDNNGNYTPENCRWSSPMEQAQNTRTNRMITYNGRTQPLIVWARELGIDYQALRGRLHYGWTVERAFTAKPYEREK